MSLKLKKTNDGSIPMSSVLEMNKIAKEEETTPHDFITNVFPPTGTYSHRSLDLLKVIATKSEEKNWEDYSSKEAFEILLSFFKSLGLKDQANQLMEYTKTILPDGVYEKLISEKSTEASLNTPKS